ncbi:MAG: iron ABC transporter permease [Novosphingobium sp.]|nr:iron ABC transporter permease [Novosphingobium sp.]
MVVGLAAGHEWASPARLVAALTGDRSLESRLITDWRLPRVLAAAAVGALLGIGGCLFQGLFRNPLAEPYLLGSAGGAAAGATIALLVPLGFPQALVLPLLAFLGAWGATVLVLLIGRVSGVIDAGGLLLAGVAVAAILGALRSFLMLALSDETVSLQVVLSWVLGGIQTPSPTGLAALAALTTGCLALALTTARGLDLLGLGEDMARGFGLDVKRFVALAILVGSAIVAVAVAFGGLVAFVGLAAPHIGRSIVGPRHRPLILASAFIGAIAVVLADAFARAALPPAEIPLGLITALAGGPFFLLLLARRMRP